MSVSAVLSVVMNLNLSIEVRARVLCDSGRVVTTRQNVSGRGGGLFVSPKPMRLAGGVVPISSRQSVTTAVFLC